MVENRIFGDKTDFAIELGDTKAAGKYKLCFWVQGKKMGSFTKAGELSSSKAAWEKIGYKVEAAEFKPPTKKISI